MRRTVISWMLIVAAVVCLTSATGPVVNDPAFDEIRSIVKSLSEISGFSEVHPIPYGRMSKRQLRSFLNKRIKKTLKPDEIKADELALKMFGLVPQDFDLKKSTLDLLTEQAAAFYDYDAKQMFLMGESSSEDEKTTLAHELAHALADQHYNLEKFMDESPANDDENLAHTAVVEGQASWLMIAYELKAAGKSPVPTLEDLKTIADNPDDSSSEYPVLKNSPLYIRESLLFPYTDGTLFFDAVYRKLGKAAFDEVFEHAPVDSAQIIHPEKYFEHISPVTPKLPDLSLTGNSEEITDGDVGEFDHEMLIRQYLGPTVEKNLPSHLRGARFKIIGAGKRHHPVLDYASQWDTPDSADEFFDVYKTILRKKWLHCEPSINQKTIFAGSGDNGYFVAHVHRNIVFSVEGIQDPSSWEHIEKTALQ